MYLCRTLTFIYLEKKAMHASKIHVALNLLILCITPHLEGENINTLKYLFKLMLARAYRGTWRTDFLDQICAASLQNVPLRAAKLWLLCYGFLKLKTRRNDGLTSGTTLFISPLVCPGFQPLLGMFTRSGKTTRVPARTSFF